MMRILFILSVIFISIENVRSKLELKRDKEIIVDIDSPELHQSQYHTADFNTSAYNYGYAVEPNGQFHHETRGGDGVTYGCYGYIDSDDLLKVTHYVADSQGYRTLEHQKPVLIYPNNENVLDTSDIPQKPKGILVDWKDLYFPIGCGMAKGGVLLNAPVIRAPEGYFQQVGETKVPILPILPSAEPKVVVPHIPFTNGITIEPTKLIPVNRNNVDNIQHISRNVPASRPSTKFASPATDRIPLTQRTTNQPRLTTKLPTININFDGPEYSNKISASPFDHTVPPTRSSSTFKDFQKESIPTIRTTLAPITTTIDVTGETIAPFRETVSPFRGTVAPSRETIPPFRETIPPFRETVPPFRDTVPPFRETLPPFRETISPFRETLAPNKLTPAPSDVTDTPSTVNDIQTNKPATDGRYTVKLNKIPSPITPFQSIGFQGSYSRETNEGLLPPLATTVAVPDSPEDDLNIINLYSQIDSSSPRITTADQRNGENKTPFSFERPSSNRRAPPTFATFKPSISTEKVDQFSTIRPTNYQFNRPTTTESPLEYSTQFSEFATIFTTESDSGITDFNADPYTAPNAFSVIKSESSKTSSIHKSKNPDQIGSSTPNTPTLQETFSTQSTFAGIGDYKKPEPGLEFNIPTRSPSIAPNVNIFVTNPDQDISNNLGGIPYTDQDKITNGPHGAEYQLGSKLPQVHKSEQRPADLHNFNIPVKHLRKEDQNGPVSLITPLTHLTFSGSFPAENGVTQPDQPSTTKLPDNGANSKPLQISPAYPDSFHGYEPTPELVTPYNEYSTGAEREHTPTSTNKPIIDFITVQTPKNEFNRGLITHMNSISQTRYQSSRVTPSINEIPSSYDGSKDASQPGPTGKSTEYPFLYTRSSTSSSFENRPQETDSFSTSGEDLNSGSFGQRVKPERTRPTQAFTAFNRGSTTPPQNYEPYFVVRQPSANSVNPNDYLDVENRNIRPNLISRQKSIEPSDKNKADNQFVNTKKEFFPQYNPNSTPIPGSLGTAIGVYPPNLDELSPELPNFSIAISKWPFYILPFPIVSTNGMTFPFINGNGMPFINGNGMPFPFVNGNGMTFPFVNGMSFPIGNVNGHVPTTTGDKENSNNVAAGNGVPAQSICSWLSSFIKRQENATANAQPSIKAETAVNANGETLEISKLQVNVNNPQLQLNQNASPNVPFGFIGFIPIIAVPNCQHNGDGTGKSELNAFPSSIQLPSLCSQLSHIIASQTNQEQANQSPPT